ncbi:MAG: DUF4252 domain-containing protein [Saprospiraceae bacterium]|jgi:hypothetical protein|nr:DUF4252 domain-containing protein [Saprospiraceae bacterium]
MMRTLILALAFILPGFGLQAQDYGLYWKYKDYDGAVALTVPRWLIHAGSWFLDEKVDRQLIRKVRKARVLVFENDDNPVTDADVQRFFAKAKKRNMEELLFVRSPEARIWVLAKERGEAIRKIVVLVQSEEAFALVTIRGKMRYDDIGELLTKMSKQNPNRQRGSDNVPALPLKIPAAIRI